MNNRSTPNQLYPAAQAPLRQIADGASMVMWMSDANDAFTYLNPGAAHHAPCLENLSLSAWLWFIHPDDLARMTTVLRQARTARTEYKVEYRIVRSDGSVRWVMDCAAPRFSAGGTFLGYNGSMVDITDRHEALERLTEREAGYRLMTENSSDLISHHDPDGKLLYVSPSVRRILGYEAKELLGTNLYDHVHPDDVRIILSEIVNQLKTGAESELIEFRKRHKDGRYIWMGTKARVLADPVTMERIGTVAVTRDITFERQAKDELRKREERFRSLTDLSSDWYWETDDSGQYTFLSESVQNLFGAPASTFLGMKRIEIAGDPAQPGLRAYAESFARREVFRDIRYTCYWSTDGAVRHVNISGEPIFEDGAFKGFRGIGRDITEEVRAAQELARLAADNKALIENSLDMMLLLDGAGHILRVNEAVLDILGFTQEELLGKCYLEFLAPHEMEKAKATFAGLRSGGNTIRDYETRWIGKDGGNVYLSLAARWSDEQQLMYATARDVSERYRIRDELQRAKDRLSSILESIGDAFFAVDRNWRAIYVNQRIADLVGRARDAMLGKVIWEALPDTLASCVRDCLRQAMETRCASCFEACDQPAGAWFEVSAYPYEDGLAVFFHDVTARRESERAIRESEHRFQEVIEMTPVGYILADGGGKLLDVNPALCDMTGWTRRELVGRQLIELFPACEYGDALSAASAIGSLRGKEAVISHKDGHRVYVLVNATIKRDAGGDSISVTAFLADITERKQAEARLEQLATRDILTGLPNRALLNDRLQQMLDVSGPDEPVAVIFIDLDRFKEVNDSMGHDSGDLLLREVARRLQKHIRSDDVVARLGGDEFVVAALCPAGVESSAVLVEKLLSVLAAPFDIAGHEVFVSASIGISIYPRDGATREVLFQNADTAMYRAKAAGRNGYRFFEAEMSVEARTRMALEHALRRALERNEFELHYQPRLNLKTMAIVGMEALIRWNHPQLGRVSPLQFIPLAEERGMIESIGQWVLKEACMQTRRLMNRFGRQLRVSVNLSARQLKCADLLEQVGTALRDADLPPHLLELELTESALIEDMDVSTGMLKELRKLGIQLAVDDFGTGYSGLAYLRRFPLDTLKLDRSFVTQQSDGISSASFIKAFVDLAHALNLSVVAEGVETKEILQMLRAAACDEAQGYLFAAPLTYGELEAFLARLPNPEGKGAAG